MKKSLLVLLALFASTTVAYASVSITLQKAENGDGLFIQSTASGSELKATKSGDRAVVNSAELKNYPKGSVFKVGVRTNGKVTYCTADTVSPVNFTFTYNGANNIDIAQLGQGYICKSFD